MKMSSRKSKPIPSQEKVRQLRAQFPEVAEDVCEEILLSLNWDVESAVRLLQPESEQINTENGVVDGEDWPQLPLKTTDSKPTVNSDLRSDFSTNASNHLSTDLELQGAYYNPFFPDGQSQVTNRKDDGGVLRSGVLPSYNWTPSIVRNPRNKSDRQSLQDALRAELKFEKSSRLLRMVSAESKETVPKLVILLRGVPGSGKSTLADLLVGVSSEGIKCSADDHFIDRFGKYSFNPKDLTAAHAKSQAKCKRAMMENVTPIVIDNTNTKSWEMIPYAELAMEYGYGIEVLEPNTSWKRDARVLAMKNTHSVPKTKIREMLERFEQNVTPESLRAQVVKSSNNPAKHLFKMDSKDTGIAKKSGKHQWKNVDSAVVTFPPTGNPSPFLAQLQYSTGGQKKFGEDYSHKDNVDTELVTIFKKSSMLEEGGNGQIPHDYGKYPAPQNSGAGFVIGKSRSSGSQLNGVVNSNEGNMARKSMPSLQGFAGFVDPFQSTYMNSGPLSKFDFERPHSVPPGFAKPDKCGESLVKTTDSPTEFQDNELFAPVDGDDWFDLKLNPNFLSQITSAYSDFESLNVSSIPEEALEIRVPPKLAFELFQLFSMSWLQNSPSSPTDSETRIDVSTFSPSTPPPPEDTEDDEVISQVLQMEELTSCETPDLGKIMYFEEKLEAREKQHATLELSQIQTTLAERIKLDKLKSGFPSVDKKEIEKVYARCRCSYDEALTTLKSMYGRRFIGISDSLDSGIDKRRHSSASATLPEYHGHKERFDNPTPLYIPPHNDNYKSAQEWRDEACKHHFRRADLMKKMTDSLNQHGQKGSAMYYLEEIKVHTERMKYANEKASELILRDLNKLHADRNTIDLHHLYVTEAIRALDSYVQDKLAYMRKRNIRKLDIRVITGIGNNSLGNVSRLVPAVKNFLQGKHLPYMDLIGTIVVTLR